MKPTTIKNITDLAKLLTCDTIEELETYFAEEIYPVTLTYSDEAITLTTDADRVPFTKTLRFPFDESEYTDAMVGLQCVTDYAMHEGYDHTHEDLFKHLALLYGERHGVYEYKVTKEFMEYWSLYDDGFYFYRIDLNTNERTEVCHLPWRKEDGYPVPAFLLSKEGYTLYNYFEG